LCIFELSDFSSIFRQTLHTPRCSYYKIIIFCRRVRLRTFIDTHVFTTSHVHIIIYVTRRIVILSRDGRNVSEKKKSHTYTHTRTYAPSHHDIYIIYNLVCVCTISQDLITVGPFALLSRIRDFRGVTIV